jgi:GST-like protein
MRKMTIELHTWNTPNGRKISVALEEMGLPYEVFPINITKGEQMAPEFLAISPNNKIPAIVDPDGPDGKRVSVFESGAILLYLAEKVRRFLPADLRLRTVCTEWLFWQMAGLGPMAGQNHHFNRYAPEKIPYAIERYERETRRLYTVLNQQLQDRDFICDEEYTIADMACYPWIVPHKSQNQSLDDFPHIKRWFAAIRARPGTLRAYAQGDFYTPPSKLSDEARRILFEHGKRS